MCILKGMHGLFLWQRCLRFKEQNRKIWLGLPKSTLKLTLCILASEMTKELRALQVRNQGQSIIYKFPWRVLITQDAVCTIMRNMTV